MRLGNATTTPLSTISLTTSLAMRVSSAGVNSKSHGKYALPPPTCARHGPSTAHRPGKDRSLHRLDVGFDEGDLLSVEAVLRVQLLIDLLNRPSPDDV